jgi:hypothetical protein
MHPLKQMSFMTGADAANETILLINTFNGK